MYVIATIVISNGVWLLIYTPETWGAVVGALYIVVAIGLMNLDMWARVVILILSMLDVGHIGLTLIRRRHLPVRGSLALFCEFLLYAAIFGYLLMPRIGRVFTRNAPKVSSFATNK